MSKTPGVIEPSIVGALALVAVVLQTLEKSATISLMVCWGIVIICIGVVLYNLWQSQRSLTQLGIIGWESSMVGGTTTDQCITSSQQSLRFLGIAASKWLRKEDELRKMLRRHAQRGGKAEFLLLNPDCLSCAEFNAIQKREPGDLANVIRKSVNALIEMRDKERLPIEVRFYSQSPVFRVVIIDASKILVGLYSHSSRSGEDTPQLCFGAGSIEWSYYYAFNALFASMWSSAILPNGTPPEPEALVGQTIVMPPNDPDLDGLACAVAYSEFLNLTGVAAAPFYLGSADGEAQYYLRRARDLHMATPEQARRRSSVILVDASNPKLMPPEFKVEEVCEVIDHRVHGSPERFFPNAELQIEAVGAAATLIAERFLKRGWKPTKTAAEMLYGAIYSNTLLLRGSVTTKRDHDAAKWLERTYDLSSGLLNPQFNARRADILKDLDLAVERESRSCEHPTGNFVFSQLEFSDSSTHFQQHEDLYRAALHRLGSRVLLNVIDIKGPSSRLLVPDPSLRDLIAQSLNIHFFGEVAFLENALLRKQIIKKIESHVP